MINRLALILVSLGIFQYSVSQKTSNNIDGVTINHAISEEVEKYISSSGYDSLPGNILLYNNRLMIEFRQDDKPIISTFDAVNNKLFKSFYHWRGDSLIIDGAFGIVTGVGFSIKIHNNKAVLFHLLSSDENPIYSLKQTSRLKHRIDVSCKSSKMTLSEIPELDKDQVIFGYVEFESNEFFESAGGRETGKRTRCTDKMKIYFKANKQTW